MELQSNNKQNVEWITEWIQFKLSPWFVESRENQINFELRDKFTHQIEMKIDVPKADQNDINVLTAQLEITNIKESNGN